MVKIWVCYIKKEENIKQFGVRNLEKSILLKQRLKNLNSRQHIFITLSFVLNKLFKTLEIALGLERMGVTNKILTTLQMKTNQMLSNENTHIIFHILFDFTTA